MFIVYGTRGFDKILSSSESFDCKTCGNNTRLNFVRNRAWFTLFWIPIFPIKSSYFYVCATCGDMNKLSKEEAKRELAKLKETKAAQKQ